MGKTVLSVLAVAAAVAIVVFAPEIAGFIGPIFGSISVTTALVSIGLGLVASFAFRALGVGAPSAQNRAGPPQVFRQSISNSFIVYGKIRVGGLLVFFHSKQGSDGAHYRYFVIAVAGHQCKGVVQWMLNDEKVSVSGNVVTSGKYANNAWLWFVRGTATDAALSTFVSECDGKWTTAHAGKGVAKIYAKFKLVDAVVEAGMPNITAIIEGRDEIIDPRTAAPGYTRNAALIFYDFNRIPREEGGFGAYADEIPDNTWVSAQANVCDETVNGQPRYAIDGVITTGAPPSEIRDVLIVNQAGTYTYSNGKHLMRPGYWVVPNATLAETDLAGPIQVSAFLTADNAINEVQGTYISPEANYAAQPLTTWKADPAQADIRQNDVDLAFTTNKDQGDRILAIMGKRAQAEKIVTWPENIMGLSRRAMDTVMVDKADYGLSNYAWVISSWQFAADYGAVMTLREENAEIYGDVIPTAPAPPPTITQPDPIPTGGGTDTQTALRSTYVTGLTVSASDAGSSATVSLSAFTMQYPTAGVAIAAADITGLAYSTTYYLYADVDAVGDSTPTFGATTNFADALNSDAHPNRVYLQRSIVTPAQGGGSTGGTGGGGGYGGCPWIGAFVHTARGWVMAPNVVVGDEVMVLDEDGTGTAWATVTANVPNEAPCFTIRGLESGISLTVSETTPITLRDGTTIMVTEIDGHELPFERDGAFWWEACSIESEGKSAVQHISCGGKTFSAGNGLGAGILTHNQVKP